MPEGFTLVVTEGRGWRSFGWVRRVDGHVVSARHGDRSEIDALRTARENARWYPDDHARIRRTLNYGHHG